MSFDVSIVPCGSYDMVETRAALSAALPLAGREIAVSIVFVIPIFFLYNALHKRFRFE